MTLWMEISQALDALSQHRLRTMLSLLGMIFGVGAVIAMLSVGEGAEREALSLIESMGLHNIIVRAGEFENERLLEIREKSIGLSLRDLEAARQTLPFLSASSALKKVNVYALYSHVGLAEGSVLGVTPSHGDMARLILREGRFILPVDDRLVRQVCVLGSGIAFELFRDKPVMGNQVKINHLWFTVVGILDDRRLSKDQFEGVKLEDESNLVFIPLKTALKRFEFKPIEDQIDEFRVRLDAGIDSRMATSTLDRLLKVRHGEVKDYELVVPEMLLEQHRQTQRIFTIVMASIAGISLLVGGIGIMNIMLASILERTREIGIRRAVGARRRDIRRQFILETFTIAAVGGLMGIAFGIVLAFGISRFAGWQVAWSIRSILLAVGVCGAIGLIVGIYPAARAARLDPIVALRYE
jgi:putative ABC transport system permease protein